MHFEFNGLEATPELHSLEAIKKGKNDFIHSMPKRIFTSDKKLKNLYEKKAPISALERAFNCSESTIYRRLKKAGAVYRRPKNIPISKEDVEELYYNEKKTMAEIAQKYGRDAVTIGNRMKKYRLKPRNISEAHYKSPKRNFDGSLIEKAHLVGFRLGDLHVRKFEENGKVLNVSCASSNQNQIGLFLELFNKYCRVTVSKPNKKRIRGLNANLNESFNFLIKKEDEIECWILSDENLFLSFLAGYVDAEGSIKVHKQGFATFRLGSYDKNILKQIKGELEKLGLNGIKLKIESKAGKIIKGDHKPYRTNKDFWRLSIYKKFYLKKLFSLIKPFIKHQGKFFDIIKAEANIDIRNQQYDNSRFNGGR